MADRSYELSGRRRRNGDTGMCEIVLFAGTTEGRELAQFLNRYQVAVHICVATEYGGELVQMEHCKVHTGRLDAGQMREMFKTLCGDVLVVDATHPYAAEASANIRKACEGVRRSDCYPDVQCRELVGAIARKEQVPVEYVVCSNGAAELIFSLTRVLRPKKALLVAPGFAEYAQALAGQDCEIVYYPLRKEEGFSLGDDYLDYHLGLAEGYYRIAVRTHAENEELIRVLESCGAA